MYRPIYVNVDSPNIGCPYLNFLGEGQWKKNTLYVCMYVAPQKCTMIYWGRNVLKSDFNIFSLRQLLVKLEKKCHFKAWIIMKHSNSFNLQLLPYQHPPQPIQLWSGISVWHTFSSLYSSVFISSPRDIFWTICGRIFARKKLIKISPACSTPNPSQRPTDPPTWFEQVCGFYGSVNSVEKCLFYLGEKTA